ncbi:MAG: NADH-ubiquinone oxidoreductase-F iron-sulfur binding region domain-containing protein [Bacillota bacterium]
MIKDLNDLREIRNSRLPYLEIRQHPGLKAQFYQVMICTGTGCTSSGSIPLKKELEERLAERKLEDRVKVFKTGCFGFCKLGPIVVVHPGAVFYHDVRKSDIPDLIEEHFLGGRVLERLLYEEPDTGVKKRDIHDIHFFSAQKRVALRHCGLINPEDIEEYIAAGGYFALEDCLNRRKPGQIIDDIKRSGLRGRGGGGFPVGLKWEAARAAEGPEKYVVCNADEGDPGAFMDRSILEGDPYSVLEAMTIAGYAIGAGEGYIYVRAEYPIAVGRLEKAIARAGEYGLLGDNILGSGFDFRIDIRLGAGAFVCGEETALLKSAVGLRGEPRPRPPYPAQCGLWGKPTLLNNVETFANIPEILTRGPDWYASIGTEKSKGTKVFSLAGKIVNTGLIEVPMGTTLRQIIFDIGGGIPNGKRFKAVQTGGPSGGCLPEKCLDTPIDYESLRSIGSIMGSGGLIVMDEDDCMVDISKFYLQFSQDESCGKCTPCRIGTKRMLEILERITEGKGEMEDLYELEDLSREVMDASLCGLGQTAPNPVLSTIRHFRDEYEAHILDKECPAGVCRALLDYVVDEGKCVSCGLCARACVADAVTGDKKGQPYFIDRQKCLKCGACQAKCPKGAIYVSSAARLKTSPGVQT